MLQGHKLLVLCRDDIAARQIESRLSSGTILWWSLPTQVRHRVIVADLANVPGTLSQEDVEAFGDLQGVVRAKIHPRPATRR